MRIYHRFLQYFRLADPAAKQTREHKAVKNGPMGTLDSYQQIYAGDGEAAWYVASVKRTKKPKTIILSLPALAKRRLIGHEYELLDAFVKHHAVYVWKGSHQPLVNDEPITESSAVRVTLNVAAESARQIKKALASQGLDVNQFIILDQAIYDEMLETFIIEAVRERAIDSNQMVITMDETARLKQTYHQARALPNLHSKCHRHVEKIGLCKDYQGDQLIQPEFPIDMESLSLVDSSHDNLDLTVYSSLKQLTLNNCRTSGMKLPKNLVTLEIKGYFFEKHLDLSVFQHLETVKIVNSEGIESLTVNHKLTHLQLRHCYSLARLDLNNIEYLHTLELTSAKSDFAMIGQESLHTIDHLRLTNCGNVDEYVEKLIARLQCNYDLDLRMLSVQSLSLQQRFHCVSISDCESLQRIEATQSPTLHTLLLTNCHRDLKPDVQKGKVKVQVAQDEEGEHALVISKETVGALSPDLSSFIETKQLLIQDDRLQDVSFYPAMLQSLTINDCISPYRVLDLAKFTQLETLTLSRVTELKSVKNIPNTVKVIYLEECPDLRVIDLIHLQQLQTLYLVGLKDYHLHGLSNITHIEELHINGLLDRAGQLKHQFSEIICRRLYLENVEFSDMKELTVGNLSELHLVKCHELRTFKASNNSLQKLHITECDNLSRVDVQAQKLEELVIRDNPLLELTGKLVGQDRLRYAVIEKNNLQRNVGKHKRTTHELTKRECIRFYQDWVEKNYENEILDSSKFVERMIGGSARSVSERMIHESVSALVLDAKYLEGHVIVPDLSRYKSLKTLVLRNMIIPAIDQLPPTLTSLTLNDCYTTKKSLDFSSLTQLQDIILTGIAELVEIKGFNELAAMEATECKHLQIIDVSRHQRYKSLVTSACHAQLVGADLRFGTVTLSGLQVGESFANIMRDISYIYNLNIVNMDTASITFAPFNTKIHALAFLHCNKVITLDLRAFADINDLTVKRCFNLLRLDNMPPNLQSITVMENAKFHVHVCELPDIRDICLQNNNFFSTAPNLFRPSWHSTDHTRDTEEAIDRYIAGMSADEPIRFHEDGKITTVTGNDKNGRRFSESIMPDLRSHRSIAGKPILQLEHLANVTSENLPLTALSLRATDCKFKHHLLDLRQHGLFTLIIVKTNCLEKLWVSPNQQILELTRCPRLKEVDLGGLTYLVKLKLGYLCRDINMVGLSEITTIQYVALSGELPAALIQQLLYSGKEIFALELDMINDTGIRIPAGIKEVSISLCGNLQSLEFDNINDIEVLKIEYCSALQHVDLPPNLKELTLKKNTSLLLKNMGDEINQRPKLTTYTITSNHPDMDELYRNKEAESTPQSIEHHINMNNQTAIVNLLDEFEPDTPDAPDNKQSHGDNNRAASAATRKGCVIMLADKYHHIDHNKAFYRFNTFNRIVCDITTQHFRFIKDLTGCLVPFKPVISPHLGSQTLNNNRKLADQHHDIAYGNVVALLAPNTYLPLITTPLSNPEKAVTFYSNQAHLLDFHHDKYQQKLYITLKPNADVTKVEISYHYQKRHVYLIKQIDSTLNIFVSETNLLDDTLRLLIDALIDNEPRLAFLRDKRLLLADKLNCLRSYCRGFADAEIDSGKQPSTLKILFDIIKKRQGVCRHRAEAFMLLSHYLNVPSCMQTNERHAFIDLPTITTTGEYLLLGVDLGGRPSPELDAALSLENELNLDPFLVVQQAMAIKYQPAPAETLLQLEKNDMKAATADAPKEAEAAPPLTEATVATATASPSVSAATADIIATKQILLAAENQLFPPITTLTSIVALLDDNSPRAPLFKLTPSMDPLLINQAILRELQHCQRNELLSRHLYIHSPADINRYLDTIVIKDGQRAVIRGRLYDLLENGGLLVVNWSTFSATQKSSFMCLLENDGTLRGHPVSPNLFIISLLHIEADSACEAFLTRTQLFKLDTHYCQKWSAPNNVLANHPHSYTVDLYGLPNWQERLLGEVVNQGMGLQLLENGALLLAMKQGLPLTIYNPPTQMAFEVFIKRLLTERKFLHNGAEIRVPDDFTVTITAKSNPLQLKNVTVLRAPTPNAAPGIFINANNLQQCYKLRIVDNATHIAKTEPGWFSKETHFYITDLISNGEWQEILTHIAKYPDRHFQFTLLAGAEIEGVATSSANSSSNKASHVIYSNDHDFCAKQLAARFGASADIIDITPDTTYDRLIAVSKETRNKHGQMQSSYRTKLLADAMATKRVVILNGAINGDLYQLLLPYLHPELAVIYHNGVKVECIGQLYCVMPLACKEDYATLNYHVASFELSDYTPLLPADQADDMNKLNQLVAKANELPHQGIGHPAAAPELTFQRYQYQLQRLRNREQLPHASNPTKGLLLASYPKNSTAYQQLNKMGKVLFASKKPVMKPVHEHKPFQQLQQLIANADTRVVFLKGSHGTSKSYSLRELEKTLPKGQFFKGIKEMKAWLVAKPIDDTQRLPITLDEGNMYLPGFFDILKGLARGYVIFNGKKYHTTPNHIALVTANFESYPNRYFHPFFEQYAETIIFTMPTDAWLAKYLIQPGLSSLNMTESDRALVQQQLLWVFNHITDFQPLLALSLRDMKSLLQRFALLYQRENNVVKALQSTCDHEFTLGFTDNQQRQGYLAALNIAPTTHSEPVRKYGDLFIPAEKFQLIDTIAEDLAICDAAAKDNKSYRYGILLEGCSGVGKSSFYKAILELNGYSRSSIDPAKRYYMVSVDGSHSAALHLLKAYFNGSKIILDEINLNPDLEELLNDLLEGVLPTNPIYTDLIKAASTENAVPLPGFFVLATQNPATMVGRGVSSLALMNRFHRLTVEDYTDRELLNILKAAQIENPSHVLSEFKAARARDPEFYNPRKLFEWMKAHMPVAAASVMHIVPTVSDVTPVANLIHEINVPTRPLRQAESLALALPKTKTAETVTVTVTNTPASPTSSLLKWLLVALIAVVVAGAAVGITFASGGVALPLLIGIGIASLLLTGTTGSLIKTYGDKATDSTPAASTVTITPVQPAIKPPVVADIPTDGMSPTVAAPEESNRPSYK